MNKTAFLHGRSFGGDGAIHSLWTKEVPAKRLQGLLESCAACQQEHIAA